MSSAKWRPFCLGLNVLIGHVTPKEVKPHMKPCCRFQRMLKLFFSEIDDYITCTADVAVKYCGADAGAWQRKYAERMQGPVKQYLGCQTGNCTIMLSPKIMMTSSNGNIFRVTGHLCGEFTGHRWFETPSRPLWRHCNVLYIKWKKMFTSAMNGEISNFVWKLHI